MRFAKELGLLQRNLKRRLTIQQAMTKTGQTLCCRAKNLTSCASTSLTANWATANWSDILGCPKSRPTHVVLITSRRHALSQEVLQSNSYLRPKGIDPPFFFWEDFYPVVASHNERLAQDFTAYMRDPS